MTKIDIINDINEIRAFTTKYEGLVNKIITPVGFSVPQKFDQANHNIELINSTAIWDTGATGSVITPSLAAKLKIRPTGVVPVMTAGGLTTQNTYLINIYLPSKVILQMVEVTECQALLGDGAEALIGMNVICLGDFAVTNHNKKTIVSFRMPSQKTIDFVEGMNRNISGQSHSPTKHQKNAKCFCGSGKKYRYCHGK